MESKYERRLVWNNVTVWAPDINRKRSWWPFAKHCDKVILDNVNGYVQRGSLVAVLGPSGSGKTTLLSHLSGRSRLRSKGKVTLDGFDIRDHNTRSVSVLVPQHDLFFPNLTVVEHLNFMVGIKLHNKISLQEKKTKLDHLLRELKLKGHIASVISTLSGGEKKALTLAAALISDPQVVFCDEPTTGLDTYSAMCVVDLLKGLANKGKIVVCSIHQPSSQIFHRFDEIILVADGTIVFQGGLYQCLEFYESFGLFCPITYNPAEFYLKYLVKTEDDNDSIFLLRTSFAGKNSSFDNLSSESEEIGCFEKSNTASWVTQFCLLIWRSWKCSHRQIGFQIILMLATLMAAGVISASCWGIVGTTQHGIQDIRGLLWLVCSEIAFTCSWSVLEDFSFDMAIYKRESDLYSASAFYLVKFVSMIPRFFMYPYLYLAVIYVGVRFPSPLLTYLSHGLVLSVTALASGSYGLMLAAQFTDSGIVGDIVVPIDLVTFLLSGVFINLKTFPIWLAMLKYTSYFFYGMEAISIIYWRQIEHIDCPDDKTLPCIDSGQKVLEFYGYDPNALLIDIGGLVAIILVMNIIGILALKRKGQKGDVAY